MKKKEDPVLINLELERSKINRERSILVLDKALMLYFTCLFVAVIGFIGGYIDKKTLDLLIMMSFGVLIVGIIPYWVTMKKEEQRLDTLIFNAKKSRGGRNA
jgi:hypothetical protein